MNLETQDYDEELLKLWNIPRCILPEIVDTSKMLAMSESVFTTQCQSVRLSVINRQRCLDKRVLKKER